MHLSNTHKRPARRLRATSAVKSPRHPRSALLNVYSSAANGLRKARSSTITSRLLVASARAAGDATLGGFSLTGEASSSAVVTNEFTTEPNCFFEKRTSSGHFKRVTKKATVNTLTAAAR